MQRILLRMMLRESDYDRIASTWLSHWNNDQDVMEGIAKQFCVDVDRDGPTVIHRQTIEAITRLVAKRLKDDQNAIEVFQHFVPLMFKEFLKKGDKLRNDFCKMLLQSGEARRT